MKKYALVEWTNEADAGSYSVVNSEWILGYTPEMYLIEWREGQGRKKPPSGGWPMGEAKILQTSDKESELKKALHDMTSQKSQNGLVVSGKRKRIPKKRLYESDDETDTDVGRSSGDEKKRSRKTKKAEESDVSPSSSQRKAGQKRVSSEDQTQPNKDQEPNLDQEPGQEDQDPEAFPDTSSDREIEYSTDGMGPDVQGDEMEDGEEEEEEEEEEELGSEGGEYPPEYELSELEKLRLEVRGLRDEIMLLRHEVCKELPKVHAIALKALGTHNNVSCSPEDKSSKVIKRKALSQNKFAVSKGRRRPGQLSKAGVVKKEADILRQKANLEKISGKPKVILSPTKLIKNEMVPSPSPSKKQATQNSDQVEIHPGSGVFINREVWDGLNALDQPTAFTRRLLPFVFSMETLLNSNLRGGKSTRDSSAEPRQALDPKKVDAIYKAVTTRFPNISHCDIGQAINGRLSSIRYREQKREHRRRLKQGH
ncbi:uncharacterized protein LOC129254364 isoform X1 [Lytechinus pictus]|uniref:uncharacterized protein LOC129254364 isoform X1 n=1 Tax=Lytechinus pictus TaxID=7653 RepID=UPI0030BA14C7